MSRVVAGLDIGTNFIRVVIAKIDADQKPEVIGVAKKPSPPEAFRQGGIVNIDDVARVVRETVTEAENIIIAIRAAKYLFFILHALPACHIRSCVRLLF